LLASAGQPCSPAAEEDLEAKIAARTLAQLQAAQQQGNTV
jgi:hypothetical protein